MPVLYHYTSHDRVKSIRKDGQINPSPGFYDRNGVWLTLKGPDHSKEEILWNNYEYHVDEASNKLRRAACYVELFLPLQTVEDLGDHRNHEDQDLWLWPHTNGPLVLNEFYHRFGAMEGTVDYHLRDKVLAAANRAYHASSITQALRNIEFDKALAKESKNRKIGFVSNMLRKIVKSKYHIIELDATDTEDPFIWTQRIGLFLCDYVVSDNRLGGVDDSELLFDKFLDKCALTYMFLGIMQ